MARVKYKDRHSEIDLPSSHAGQKIADNVLKAHHSGAVTAPFSVRIQRSSHSAFVVDLRIFRRCHLGRRQDRRRTNTAIALPPGIVPQVARVRKTEEKGSDVNLGVHLVRDAFKGYFDTAAVLTNDTDLCEPLRIVTQELNLPVILLSPEVPRLIQRSLQKASNGVRHIEPYLGPAQLPSSIPVPGK